MGISSSSTNRRRNNQNYLHNSLPPPPQQPYYYPTEPPNGPYSAHPVHNPYYAPQPPPPPFNCAYYNRTPYYANQAGGWPAITAPVDVSQAEPPPPYVDHQNAKKVRNDVNVRKDTVKLEVDPQNQDHHLVSFDFDAVFDGSITISYFAKEESNCVFIPVFPEMYEPVTVPFQKGIGQKFQQLSGTGIDLGFFSLDDLSKPSSAEDVFPLVISSETSPDSSSSAHNKQITQAVIEKNGSSNAFQVKVVRQILWIDGVRYELRDLYGVASSAADEEFEDDNNSGKECVICLTQPKDTAILPCRHMCMCSGCAKALRLRSNKCPICRQPMEELIEIKS